jgi:hypothetical protein
VYEPETVKLVKGKAAVQAVVPVAAILFSVALEKLEPPQ